MSRSFGVEQRTNFSCLVRERLFAQFIDDLRQELDLRRAFATWVWKDGAEAKAENWYKLRRHAQRNTTAAWENFVDHIESHRCK